MSENIVISESTPTETEKVSFIKKALKYPKTIAVVTGSVLLLTAATVVFAFKRQDEEDFDDEFPPIGEIVPADEATL